MLRSLLYAICIIASSHNFICSIFLFHIIRSFFGNSFVQCMLRVFSVIQANVLNSKCVNFTQNLCKNHT